MMSDYALQQKEIIKQMVKDFKEYEYNSYSYEINKLIIVLNNSEFTINDINFIVKDYKLYITLDLHSDYRQLNLTINNLKFLVRELQKVARERKLI